MIVSIFVEMGESTNLSTIVQTENELSRLGQFYLQQKLPCVFCVCEKGTAICFVFKSKSHFKSIQLQLGTACSTTMLINTPCTYPTIIYFH